MMAFRIWQKKYIRTWDINWISQFVKENLGKLESLSIGILEDENVLPLRLVENGEIIKNIEKEKLPLNVDGVSYTTIGTPCMFVTKKDGTTMKYQAFLDGYKQANNIVFITGSLVSFGYIGRHHERIK